MSWPAILAGGRLPLSTAVVRLLKLLPDLNTTPAEATYQLLTAPTRPLHPSMISEIEESRFVHTSVDNIPGPARNDPPSTSGTGSSTPAEGGTGSNTPAEKDDEEEPPDSHERSVANTRDPQPFDGILNADELAGLARKLLPEGVKSAFGSSDWAGNDGETFAKRGGFERVGGVGELEGGGEPGYTCFTPLFKLTLGQSSSGRNWWSNHADEADRLLVYPPSLGLRLENNGDTSPPSGQVRGASRRSTAEGDRGERSSCYGMRGRLVMHGIRQIQHRQPIPVKVVLAKNLSSRWREQRIWMAFEERNIPYHYHEVKVCPLHHLTPLLMHLNHRVKPERLGAR
jgi:hypothetical protein